MNRLFGVLVSGGTTPTPLIAGTTDFSVRVQFARPRTASTGPAPAR
jgi:hypothetical protein